MHLRPTERSALVRFLREPLVVFLLLGIGVFALERWRLGGFDNDDRRIEISAREIDRLRELWSAQSHRPPNDAELRSLIEDAIEEEILVREARRLGLDKEDTIVRRRLAQKMSFLINDTADIQQPSEQELEAFFEERRDRYLEPERTTFSHVYFSSERRGDEASDDAQRILAELRVDADARSNWRRMGDPFLLNREYAERRRQEISELFGRAFAEGLGGLPVGAWSGPVRSAYGVHLVRVAKRQPVRQPPLEEVRTRVLEDLRNALRQEANRDALQKIRSRYQVHVALDTEEPGDQTADLGARR